MPDNAPQVAQQLNKTPDYKAVYSNNVNLTLTPFDFVFVFGENQSVKDNILIADIHTKVTMSPQHAKVFAQLLIENVNKWEQTFGPIVTPAQAAEAATKKPS
jgi:hypothetical protein